MGKKYIIELPENTHWIQWLMEGIKDHHPYMDFKSVEDLTPYTEPDLEQVRKEAYEQGLSDAKEGKATCQYCAYQYLDDTEEPCKRCCKAYMNKYKPKAKEEQIQVGDEVERILNGEVDSKAVFLEDDEGYYRCLFWTGCCFTTLSYPKEQFRKTGRHFPEIAEVLQKMREGQDG